MPEKGENGSLLPLKVFKLLALVALVCITIWQCVQNIQEYFKHEAVTTVSKEEADSISFPLITICNYNRWKLSLLSSEEINMVHAEYKKANGNGSSENDSSTDLYNFTYSKGWHLVDEYNSDLFTPPRFPTIGFCYFAGIACNTKFFKHRMTRYGNCYTFNEDITPNDVNGTDISLPLIQTHASETNGFDAFIIIEADDYFESPLTAGSPFLGIKVIVHSKEDQPDPISSGVSIGPGEYGTIALRRTEYNNLEPPEGNCNLTRKLQYFDTYTSSACETECKINYVEQNCSCRPYFYPKTNKMCNFGETLGCASRVIAAIDQNFSKFCNCPEACAYEEFTSTVTYAPFPSTTYGDDIVRELQLPSTSFIKTNIVGLKVYFADISSTVVTQSPAHTALSILNDIGGTTGLYVGFSFITLIELAQVIAELLQSQMMKRKNSVASIRILNDGNHKENFK